MSSKVGLRVDFGILVNVAFGAFKDALHEHLGRAGFADVGRSFGYIVRTLEPAADGLSLKQLAAALDVTPQGALKIVDDMVAKGYVTRTTDATDTRVTRLRVGPRGHALLKEARRFHARFERQLISRHGERAVAQARVVLEGMTEARPGASAPGIRMQLL